MQYVWSLLAFAPADFLSKCWSNIVLSTLEEEGGYFWQEIWWKFLGPSSFWLGTGINHSLWLPEEQGPEWTVNQEAEVFISFLLPGIHSFPIPVFLRYGS